MDLYATVTDKIVAGIENAIRWQKPWTSAFGGGKLARPVNALTRRPYNGINVMLLWSSGQDCQEWATYKAWAKAGAQVRKGERGTQIIFWKRVELEREESEGDDQGDDDNYRLIARAYYVFSASQVDGWKGAAVAAPKPAGFDPIASAEAFVAATGATIHHGGSRAFYSPALDLIKMPERSAFVGTETRSPAEAYYGTLLHELTHWTGHATRCARDFANRFGSDAYAFEELVAELGAAYLSADLGITAEPRADHAAYIAGWLKALRSDKRAIFTAASKAEQACRFLAALQPAAGENAIAA